MKTKLLLIITIAAIVLSSCKSSGWSCKKRYVNNQKLEKHDSV